MNGMAKSPKISDPLDRAKKIAALLLAQPPKTHDEMKIGKKARPKAIVTEAKMRPSKSG